MPRRAIVLAALLAAAATAAPSGAAAPKPQLTDAKGDAVGAQAGTDIVSVTYSTTGNGSGRAYVPRKLIVTLTTAGDVLTNPGITYEVKALTTTCDVVTFSAQQGTPYSQVATVNGWAEWGGCEIAGTDGPTNVQLITAVAKGNTLTWSFPIKMLPKGMKVGTVFSDFAARVDPTNPVIPFPSSMTQTNRGLIDAGAGATKWKMG